MGLLIRVNNDEECVLVQKLLNTFGYSWPMSDNGIYTIHELCNENVYGIEYRYDGPIVFETDSYGVYHWGMPDEMPGDVLSFNEFLDEIERKGGNI